jgi:hypothetical protein
MNDTVQHFLKFRLLILESNNVKPVYPENLIRKYIHI